MSTENTIYLLLGSNLGDRRLIMDTAKTLIEKEIGEIVTESLVYETAPWGVVEQPSFLNQIIIVKSGKAPEEALRIILAIEHELGRIRYDRWGARVIDIDILYFNDLILDSARLTLPHPRLHQRRFTLVPLAEIAPNFFHPILNRNSLQLLEECTDNSDVATFS